MIPFSVQNHHSLPTLSSVKHKSLPFYGLSSTAIAIALNIAFIYYWFIRHFTKIFSVATMSQSKEGQINNLSRRAVGHRIGRRRWASSAPKHRHTSSWRQTRKIISTITTLFFGLSSLGFSTLHPGDPLNKINCHHTYLPDHYNSFNAEMHQRVPWRSPS